MFYIVQSSQLATRVIIRSSGMAERTMRLWCAVPMPEKFIVHLSAVVIRQAGSAQNMFLYVARSAFFEGGGSLSANI